jgi:hypothetical protein
MVEHAQCQRVPRCVDTGVAPSIGESTGTKVATSLRFLANRAGRLCVTLNAEQLYRSTRKSTKGRPLTGNADASQQQTRWQPMTRTGDE